MNWNLFSQIFVMQLLIVSFLIFALFYLIKTKRILNYEKRISKYVVTSKYNKVTSIGDHVFSSINSLVEKLSVRISKIRFLKKQAKHYNKYFAVSDNIDSISSYRIITFKILIAVFFGILYLFSSLFGSLNYFLLIIFMIIGYYIYDFYLFISFNKRKKIIEADLLKAIVIMNNAFKSGYNITQAIDFVIRDLTGPICDEFKRIEIDLKYGLELSEVFDRFYERVHIDDVKYITSSLNLLNLTGGNIVGIFGSIEQSFTNKKKLKDELKAMTSSSNLVYRILTALPFVLIGIILIISPTYFNILFEYAIGYIIMVVTLILLVVYIFIIKKILRVDI